MQQSKTIERLIPGADPYSYQCLRREGIDYAQQFCGNSWTDYNAHDPGITILEQLCYGLVDLIYRTDFSVEDQLVNQSSTLDFEQLGLALPEQILPAQPCTLIDYRQALLDAVDEIDQLWIRPSLDAAYNGLYQIEIQLSARTRRQCQQRPTLSQKVIDKVAGVYAGLRNLGEDSALVTIIEGNGYQLKADIETQGADNVDDMMAEVYFCTGQWLSGQGADAVQSFEEQVVAGKSLDQILTGPLTVYGRLQFAGHDEAQTRVKSISSLYALLIEIKGVAKIGQLKLLQVSHDGQLSGQAASSVNEHDWFYVPKSADQVLVTASRDQHPLACNFDDLRVRYEQRQFKQYAISHTRQELSTLYQPPTGTYCELGQYQSIQGHFPGNYNLSVLAVSTSVPLQAWAKIQQLRGYLLIFDQFMANFGANLGAIRQLFSIDTKGRLSYHFSLFDNHSLRAADQLYPQNSGPVFNDILASYDPFVERKSRLLDYLLALYGETLTLDICRQFNPYLTGAELESQLLDNKVDYLKAVVLVGKDRGGGFNQTRLVGTGKNQGGFAVRLAFQLGLNRATCWPYSKVITEQGLKIVNDSQYLSLPTVEKLHQSMDEAIDGLSEKTLRSVSRVDLPGKPDQRLKTKMIESVLALKDHQLGEGLLRQGVDISRYKLLKNISRKRFDVYFNTGGDAKPWLYIGNSATERKATVFVNLFSRFMAQLNQGCEGLYVVEHILLRPPQLKQELEQELKQALEQEQEQAQHSVKAVDDNYSFRISIILPGFTARCHQSGFRAQAEQIIRSQCPAFILPDCYWLDFAALTAFETLYLDWLEARRLSVVASPASFTAGQQLMAFLRSQPNEPGPAT
ncbi:MAG: hypothetical protein ACI8WB_001338 [Phenylobacterium sp.]|jgi:hypothetical protein